MTAAFGRMMEWRRVAVSEQRSMLVPCRTKTDTLMQGATNTKVDVESESVYFY